MAQVGLTLDFSGYTGSLIVVWYKNTSPLVEVDRSAALPFPVSEVVTATDLDPETYTFKFYQSDNGVALTTLLRSWAVDASAFGEVSVQQFEYVCDRGNSGAEWADPVTGDTEISDTRLAGAAQSDCELYTEGVGRRRFSDWEMLPSGGIKLLTDAFGSGGQVIFVTRFSKGSTSSSSTSSTTAVDVVDLSVSATFDTAHKGKLINCTGTAAVTTYSLTSLATMPDCVLSFSTHEMEGNYLTIQLQGIDKVNFHGQRSAIHLAKCESIDLVFRSNNVYVRNDSTGYRVLGNRELVDVKGIAQELLDGATEYQISEWPRIAEWVNALPANMIITTYSSWTPDYGKHKYYYNTSAGVFRLPNDQGMFYRALNSGATDALRYGTNGVLGGTNSNTAGTYQADDNKEHTHEFRRPTTDTHGTQYETNKMDGGSDRGLWTGDLIDTEASGGEARGKNVGQLAVINI